MGKGVAGGIQRIMHMFLPRAEEFFPLFEAMGEKAHDGALVLQQVFQGGADLDALVKAIGDIEHDVDHLRHDCVQRLNDTFVTPIMFDRQDILDLADELDEVVDYTRAAVDRMALYRVKSVPQAARDLAAILVQCTEMLASGCKELDRLRSSDAPFIKHVNSLENHADSITKQALADLFNGDTDPVEIIKWKEIYDYVEEAIDHCEDTVHIIEAALVKNS